MSFTMTLESHAGLDDSVKQLVKLMERNSADNYFRHSELSRVQIFKSLIISYSIQHMAIEYLRNKGEF